MSWNRLLMIVVLAAICFGGSFTCKGHSGNHNTTITTN
jgi:type IV secretory pathway VirB2 component (pilin)